MFFWRLSKSTSEEKKNSETQTVPKTVWQSTVCDLMLFFFNMSFSASHHVSLILIKVADSEDWKKLLSYTIKYLT